MVRFDKMLVVNYISDRPINSKFSLATSDALNDATSTGH